MRTDSPKLAARNSTTSLLQKAIAEQLKARPQDVKLTDREKAMCAVFDHQMRLHCFDRDGYGRRLEALEYAQPRRARTVTDPEPDGRGEIA